MTATDELADWLRLTLTPGIGGVTQRKLLAAFGLPHRIFAAGADALRAVAGDRAAALQDAAPPAAEIETALDWASRPGRYILTLADPDYPPALLETPDPPTLLYVRGRREALTRPALAIVGSRNATPQGEGNARAFAATLAGEGFAIVSGLALGIDAAAHSGTLAAGGITIAVVGTGADRLYPARNRELAERIADDGAIVSEFPLGTPATAANFPRRNRIISGLARGVLVVEAAVESGSLITARLAGEQGREVFAIPGSIHSPQSRGCHRLIRQGAKLVETADDILEEFRAGLPAGAHPGEGTATPTTDDDTAGVLAQAGFDPVGFDELAVRTGLTADALSVILLRLELDGRVASLPGGRYQRLAEHAQ
jgi:DNA processing protein